ncbi:MULTISPECIES: sugar porter family MFS transporter [Erwinia]|jgi:SP family galactose:H+ symporter-like MFS transporter|uniref:Galactose-proton symport (Galactose transporter) n=1 Tax=Erwinia billingiae (strain Eb661) TaxID=634500 RepID=D8MWI8_ERWBE|nr:MULTISPECIES: sugar porter family MFS transporter [Erwinia]MBN7122361.1 MFS transporter [Erwinia billingiae]MCX0497772.1 sugar porter family MFS transporter [Erwinia billingiae]PRB59395.1 sugar porter family MFS transporter [Erwinia billingiae]QBR48992.1 sugar porter family MFS transporter [Erwinia sp. QL-Z3]QEW30905.1 sugar porter family MFS transporter [Erwinia billingiae]
MPDNKKKSRTSNKAMTFFVCFLAALAGLLFGLDIGVIAGALPFIAKDFNVTAHQQEWIVSSMMFGAAVGAVGSGWMSSRLGRKKSLMIGAILFVIGSLWSAMSSNPEMLIFARVLLGLAVGVASYTAPLYLSEIAPEKIRGSMISLYQLMITIGILGAYLSDTAFSYTGEWRWMLGVITIPAALLLVGVCFLPNSPRWLAAKGDFRTAQRVLDRLRDTSEQAKRELDEIRESLKIKQSGWSLFKGNSNFRRAVYLGVLLQIMQQFTGMNVIMYYAPKIFEIAGFTNTTEQMWGTVIVGLVNVLATFIAIGLVDRWGRKPTLKLGFLVMAVGMGILGTMLHVGIHSSTGQYFAIAMLLMFIIGFAMSAGPLIWVLCSEIQPLKGRDFGITVSTATNWIANMIVGATFLTMLNTLGNANTFWVYAGLNVLFIILTIVLIPETKGISLEHIERNLLGGKKLRDIGHRD